MNKQYTAAFYELLKAIDNWNLYGLSHAEHLRKIRLNTQGFSPSAADIVRSSMNALETSDIFFLEAPIQQLLMDSLDTIPKDVPLGNLGFPYRRGWLVFAEPLVVAEPLLAWSGFVSWTGFSWSADDIMKPKDGEEYPIVAIDYYGTANSSIGPMLMSTQLWPYTDPIEGWHSESSIGNTIVRQAMDRDYRLIFAIFSWLTQSLALVADTPLPRQLRRDHIRRHGVDPLIRRITLRPIKRGHKTDGVNDVNWSCRWLVRGHWRNQFYAHSRQHRPLWIQTYLKGPEDKPIKRPTIPLFDMAR